MPSVVRISYSNMKTRIRRKWHELKSRRHSYDEGILTLCRCSAHVHGIDIRTRSGSLPATRFSKPPPSASRPQLRSCHRTGAGGLTDRTSPSKPPDGRHFLQADPRATPVDQPFPSARNGPPQSPSPLLQRQAPPGHRPQDQPAPRRPTRCQPAPCQRSRR